MNDTTIIILICVGVFIVLVGFITLVVLSGKRKKKRLQANLDKLSQEKEKLNFNEENLSLPSQEEQSTYNINDFEEISSTKEIEKLDSFEQENTDSLDNIQQDFNKNDTFSEIDMFEKNFSKQNKNDDDFEQFLNEHSFSRRVFNKPLINKIKKLPRDVRIMILSNVFDRIDD